jgi:pimeloyl-ACP methyl ester carboxylesterase
MMMPWKNGFENMPDFSSCFLMGGSAGGNIAYHAGLRAAEEVGHLEPLKIRGLILQQAAFGGIQRTGSELRFVNEAILPPSVSDRMWESSLPIGAHEYCNPTVGGGSKLLEKIRVLGWRYYC